MNDRDELLARLFHDTYEKLAPTFGYETREDTKQFDPTSPNGKLMIAVAGVINDTYTAHQVEDSKEPWIIRLGPVRGSFKSIRIVGEKPVKDFLKSQVAKAERGGNANIAATLVSADVSLNSNKERVMSNQEILEKAIRKAIEGGWKGFSYEQDTFTGPDPVPLPEQGGFDELDEILDKLTCSEHVLPVDGCIGCDPKAALLQCEQRLVAEAERAARIDVLADVQIKAIGYQQSPEERLDNVLEYVKAQLNDRLAQLRHNTNTGKGE